MIPLGRAGGAQSWVQLCRDPLSSLGWPAVGNWPQTKTPHVQLYLSQSCYWTLIDEQTPVPVKWAKPSKEAVPTLAEPSGEEKQVITDSLNPCSHATTALYSKTRQAVFQHGQGRNHWHLLGIFNTNLYLWNTGEVQKNPEKPSIIHILLLLWFWSSWPKPFIQARLDLVCVHSKIRMKERLYWESRTKYRAVVSVEREK